MLDSSQAICHTNQRFSIRARDRTQWQRNIFAPYVAPHHRVLAYRCGDGSLLDSINVRVTAGIEPDSSCAAAAQENGRDVRTSVSDFDGSRCTFDRILVSHTIDDQLDTVALELRALAHLLSEDGRLLFGCVIDLGGQIGTPAQHQETVNHLKRALSSAGYITENISIRRNTRRSDGFQFRASDANFADTRKTYWMVKPFLSLVAVARRADDKSRSTTVQ